MSDESEYSCPICYDDIKDNIYITNCNHKFCKKCINKWFNNKINVTCPLCRTIILNIENFNNNDFINIGSNSFYYGKNNMEKKFNIYIFHQNILIGLKTYLDKNLNNNEYAFIKIVDTYQPIEHENNVNSFYYNY
jgi:hypothetical protein